MTKRIFNLRRINGILAVMLGLVSACENSTEIIYPDTSIVVLILDDEGKPLRGAHVRLFDNEITLNEAKSKGDYSGEITSLTTDESGSALFEGLSHESSYYFFASYRDRGRLLDLENYNGSYKFPGFLPRGSKTNIRIQLQKADNVVSFFTLPENEHFLPIDIFLDGDSIGRMTEVVYAAPEGPNVSGALSFRMKGGITKWYARSPGGCLWTGEFALAGTQSFYAQELKPCKSGSISFWTSQENSAALPITVRLGALDNFGTLKTPSPVPPLACYSTYALSGNRESGTYEYIAVSADKRCTWTGTVSINDRECQIIQLTTCP